MCHSFYVIVFVPACRVYLMVDFVSLKFSYYSICHVVRVAKEGGKEEERERDGRRGAV